VLKTTPKSRYTDLIWSILDNPGQTVAELNSNFTVDGSKTIVDAVYPTNHAEHETAEITHGFNDWFECGFYIFTLTTFISGLRPAKLDENESRPLRVFNGLVHVFDPEGQSWQTG